MNNKPYIIQDLGSDKGEVVDARRVGPSGEGGSITIDTVINVNSHNAVENAAIAQGFLTVGGEIDSINEDLEKKADAAVTEDVSGTTPTLTIEANTIYKCGEVTSLIVSSAPATGDYSIIFVSGSTPTVTNFPTSIKFPTADNLFEGCEANTRYEINVSNGYALVGAWPAGA